MSGTILFLDLARQAGWAIGRAGGEIASGSEFLAPPAQGHGRTFAALDAFMADLIETNRPSVVAFEQPMDPRHMGKRTTFKTARLLMGLTAIAEACCARMQVRRTVECSVADIRKHLLGKQPARGQAKEEVMQYLKYTGFKPSDDNEADAIAGWLYCEAILSPQDGSRRLPMFSRVKRGEV